VRRIVRLGGLDTMAAEAVHRIAGAVEPRAGTRFYGR